MIIAQQEVFEAFKRNIQDKALPYLSQFGFSLKVKEEEQWITATFTRSDKTLKLSLSFHHLDYQEGIFIVLISPDGEMELRSTCERRTSQSVPVYLYSIDKIDTEFDRALKDMKRVFQLEFSKI